MARLTGGKGNLYYNTSDGEFVRQRFDFCMCSFCFRVFEFNERVAYFKTHDERIYTCIDHEQPMRDRHIEQFEKSIVDDKKWEEKRRELIASLNIKKRSKDDDRIAE